MNGELNIRKTHPNLYWFVMILAFFGIASGLNFIGGTLTTWYASPTFPIYDQPNILWGVIFLVIGGGKIVALNFYRRVRLVRALMAFAVFYMLFLAAGTCEPFIKGTGSLQNPILYAGLSAIQIPFLLEPFVNPWTAKR